MVADSAAAVRYLLETMQAHPLLLFPFVFAAILLIPYSVYHVIYSLYFHPLRSFPGPPLNAITTLPVTFSMMHGTAAHDTLTLHQEYGPVVRVEPNELSFITAAAWKDIYSWANTKLFHKARVVQPNGEIHTLPMIVEDDVHMRHRKFYNSAFSDRALRGQEAKVQSHIDLFIRRLGEGREEEGEWVEKDIKTWIEFLMFDVIGDLAFGAPFGCLQESSFHRWVAILFESMKGLTMLSVVSRFAPFDKLFYLFKMRELKKLFLTLQDHNEMSGEKVRKRIAQGEDESRQDFWSYFLQKINSEKDALTLEEMEMVGSVLIVGGSETTGAALCATVYYLLRTPEALEELCKEVRGAFGEERKIDMLSAGKLVYLHACLQEGLRLYPPAPVGLMRVAPEGGAVVAGYFVPGGVS